jgi:hypothetical protein
MPTSLHRLADNARGDLQQRAAGTTPEIRGQIDAHATKCRVSVNMKPSALERFLDGEPRLNVFQWADAESSRTGAPAEELLRTRLGRWFDLRVDFEHRAGDTRHFHYGALNLGGMGSPRYGRLCVIDGRPTTETKPDPVWVAEDSLSGARFRDANGLDWARLQAWVAPCDLWMEIVAIKLDGMGASSIPLDARTCNNDDYIEALSLSPMTRDAVEEIRSESDDDLQDRALRAVLDGASSHEELNLALHARLRDRANELSIPWRQT